MLLADLITFTATFAQYDVLDCGQSDDRVPFKSDFDLAKTQVDVKQPQ
jgi:hypothetical protein